MNMDDLNRLGMGESSEEYTIIEDEREPVQISPRCSVVKISCGIIPSRIGNDASEEEPHGRGDPYTMGRLDAAYRDAMSVLDSLFEIDLLDPEQQAVAMTIRSEMAHYRILIDRYSEDRPDGPS